MTDCWAIIGVAPDKQLAYVAGSKPWTAATATTSLGMRASPSSLLMISLGISSQKLDESLNLREVMKAFL